MKLGLELIFMCLLGILFYQDIKERKVDAWFLFSGFLVGGILHYLQQQPIVFLLNISINITFITVVFGVLYVYAKFKLKKYIFEVFGLGDLLFFIVLAVALPVLSFLMVFVFSLLFSLIIFMLLKHRFTDKTVPLAGLQSLFLLLVFMANKFINSFELYAL